MEKLINDLVNKNLSLMLESGEALWQMPEVGFKEYKTDEYMKRAFMSLGYNVVAMTNIPGFYTVVDTEKKGPTVLVLAEMDAIYCQAHPERDKQTGAVHACGHSAQMAIIVGLASALKDKAILDGLCGKIKLCVVPAEEGIDISYRKKLKEQGVIKYLSGKQEFIFKGYFDDVDLAFMLHTAVFADSAKHFSIKKGSNGIVMKEIRFIGKAAHAGGEPEKGINALNAGSLAIQAVGLLRETFKEEDYVRFHPIITKGGDVVNAVPAEVIMESYVRASNISSMQQINEKINFAIASAAAAVGASVEINDLPGYAPLKNDPTFIDLALNSFNEISGEDGFIDSSDVWGTDSTDMGDVSCIIPSIHPYVSGVKGTAHGKDYIIEDPKKTYSDGLKLELTLLKNLLINNAEKAYAIIKNFKPTFKTKEEYLEYMTTLDVQTRSEINYNSGVINVKRNQG